MQQQQHEAEIDEALLQAQAEMEEEIKKFEQGFSYRSPENLTDKPSDKESINEENITTKQKSSANLEDLSFVRLIDPIHIPSYLVEQIKNRLFPLDKFYEYLKIVCTYQ